MVWEAYKTGRASSNIAVIKYWGKRDDHLILPLNSSISVTLDPSDVSATTTVSTSPRFETDRLWLNGTEVPLSSHRYIACLQQLRDRASDVVDEKSGIVIKKQDWEKLKLHIVSVNNFPTAAGLASSAAGFACLVYTVAQLMGVKEAYPGELTAIARLGSGSACRSLYGGFVKWNMGKEADGKDSIATQLAEYDYWESLSIIIAVVSSKPKEVSSSAGMQETVRTSSKLHFRVENIVPKRIIQMEEAIASRDFATFANLTCLDSDSFHETCRDTSPPINYMNETSKKIIELVERWNKHAGTPKAAYTFDAGPNAVLFVRNEDAKDLLQRLLYQFPPPSGVDLSSYVVGKMNSTVEDLMRLPLSPPELTESDSTTAPAQGQLSYLICTRPGKGAHLVDIRLPGPAAI